MEKYFKVKAEQIVENPDNFYTLTDELVDDRRKSIVESGLRNRLKVTDYPKNENKWLLFGGHCNFRAGKLAGMKEFEVEYTAFKSNDDMLEALMLENERRPKTSKDEANEIKNWKKLLEKKQGSRSDITGEGPTDTRKKLEQKFKYSGPTIDTILYILTKRYSMFNLIDKRVISLTGAKLILKYLEEKKIALTITDTRMMEFIIEAVVPVEPKISEKYENSDKKDKDLVDAFKLAATKVYKVFEIQPSKQPEVAISDTTDNAINTIVNPMEIVSSQNNIIEEAVTTTTVKIPEAVITPSVDKGSDVVNEPAQILSNNTIEEAVDTTTAKKKINKPLLPIVHLKSDETGVKQTNIFQEVQVENTDIREQDEWELCYRNKHTGEFKPCNGEHGFGRFSLSLIESEPTVVKPELIS